MKHQLARGGFTLLEMSVSIVLVGALMSLLAQALLWRNAQQRSIEWRETAVIEAGNLMDRAMSLPIDQLTQEKLNSLTLSENLQGRTPPPRLHWALEPAVGEPPARRITLEIQLPGKGGADGRPVRLTAWKYPGKGKLGTRNSERGTTKNEAHA